MIKFNKESLISDEKDEKIKRKDSVMSHISDDELLKKTTNQRYEQLIRKMKIKITVYFVFMMLLSFFCSLTQGNPACFEFLSFQNSYK